MQPSACWFPTVCLGVHIIHICLGVFYTCCRKVDHYKVADKKKQIRQKRERQKAMQRRRVVYPILFLASIVAGLLLARFGLCSAISRQVLPYLYARRATRKRRPHALAAISSSPRSSPKLSPASSPTVKGASSSSSSLSLSNGRATQQRQAALHLLTGPRKPGRLNQ